MTKLVILRAVIPCDDDAPIGAVQERLRGIIEAAGTERLSTNGAEADAACPRAHFGAVDVRQGNGEKHPPGRPRKRVAGQGELAG
jgi:hypothetical protein